MPIGYKPLPRLRALDPLFLVRIKEAQNDERDANDGGNAGDAETIEVGVAFQEIPKFAFCGMSKSPCSAKSPLYSSKDDIQDLVW